jgi:hypothetical protein
MDESEQGAIWERACLVTVREELEEPDVQEAMLARKGWRLEDVRLEGPYRKTAIVVYYTHPDTGARGKVPFPLWELPEGFQWEWSGRGDPDEVAYTIARFMTGGWTPPARPWS